MRTPRNQSLDVLRGVAILMVIGRHVPYYSFWGKIGWAGVDLFFVLSGFLISGLLFREYLLTGKIRFGRFILRRAFKIWPPFVVFMLFVVVFLGRFGSGLPCRQFVITLGFLGNYLMGHFYVIGHTWSLAVEEHFYILLPLLLFALLSLRRREPFAPIPLIFVVIAALCFILRVLLHPSESYATHFRVDSLFAGVALGYVYHFRRAWFQRFAGHHALLLALAFCSPMALLDWNSRAMQTWGLTSLFVGFALLVGWAVERQPPKVLAPIAWIGFFSYSIYLWQQPVAVFFNDRGVHSLVGYWLYLATAVVVGVGMSKLVEIPSLALREKVLPAGASRDSRMGLRSDADARKRIGLGRVDNTCPDSAGL